MTQSHLAVRIWEVDLYISGNISAGGARPFRQLKGADGPNQFFSDVTISRVQGGVKLTVTARANSRGLADKAALVFVGHMLDVMAFSLDEPLYHDLHGIRSLRTSGSNSRSVVSIHEWQHGFDEARLLDTQFPAYLRALGWYRKGLYSEDPFDVFLAYWNAVEIVAAKYYPRPGGEKLEKTKEQVQAIFAEVWPTAEDWPGDGDRHEWTNRMYRTRNSIAHGGKSIDIHEVERVDSEIPLLRQVSRAFLRDWRDREHPGNHSSAQMEQF